MALRDNIGIEGHADQQRLSLLSYYVEKYCPATLLEVGCDDGCFAATAAFVGEYGRRDYLQVHAVDLNTSEAHSLYEDPCIHWHNLDCGDMAKHINKKFDMIHLGEVLEHVKNPHKVMQECVALSKPNTMFLVSVPNFQHPTHLRTYSMKSAVKLCSQYFIVESQTIIKHKHKKSKSERYFLTGHIIHE